MIKTVPFDIILSFMIGLAVPLLLADRVKRAGGVMSDQSFLATALFELFFFIPIGAYLYFFHTDWSLMYFVDPGQYGISTRILIGVVSLSLYMGATVLGYAAASFMVRAGMERKAAIVFVALAVLLGVFSAFTFRQLTMIGSFAEWRALPRTSEPIFFHRAGILVGVDALVATVFLAMAIMSLRREDTP